MSVVVAVVGPTAVGKSKLGIELARAFNGEIVSADSRQVYRYMDIGTAKPTADERSVVPHHLIDVVDPDEDFSVAVYQSQAMEAIDQVMSRGRLPVIVGGAGSMCGRWWRGGRYPVLSRMPGSGNVWRRGRPPKARSHCILNWRRSIRRQPRRLILAMSAG